MFGNTSDPREKLLNAALNSIRARGYAGTSVEEICQAAGVTKGSFFHHFKSKEEVAIAAVEHWREATGELFAEAPFQELEDPRERVLAYIDFRAQLIRGDLPDFTCLLGTLVQETYNTHAEIRKACERAILFHAKTIERDLAEAKERFLPHADWDPLDLALYTQAAIQGAFILAKAQEKPAAATRAIAHLRHYVASLLEERDEPKRNNKPTAARKRR